MSRFQSCCIAVIMWTGLSIGVGIAQADKVIGDFEMNLSSPYGVDWSIDSSASIAYTIDGATHGNSALAVSHDTGWSLTMVLDGGAALASDLSRSNELQFDVTLPFDACWRIGWVIMQGEGTSWTQPAQFDFIPGFTDTLTLDLNTTMTPEGYSLKEAAGSVGGSGIPPSWWQMFVVFMGQDFNTNFECMQEPGTLPTTTIDNFRLVGLTTPGDFNGDGSWNCTDVNSLVVEIVAGSNNQSFDLTGDGLVNSADLDAWLVFGGSQNPTQTNGNPFLPGDGNLDGVVDGSDFGIWNANKFTSTAAWCSGDFNADGVVDGSDFGIWNSRKFTSSADGTVAVPEPVMAWLAFVFLLGGLATRRS